MHVALVILCAHSTPRFLLPKTRADPKFLDVRFGRALEGQEQKRTAVIHCSCSGGWCLWWAVGCTGLKLDPGHPCVLRAWSRGGWPLSPAHSVVILSGDLLEPQNPKLQLPDEFLTKAGDSSEGESLHFLLLFGKRAKKGCVLLVFFEAV